jgi:hypothetical protein
MIPYRRGTSNGFRSQRAVQGISHGRDQERQGSGRLEIGVSHKAIIGAGFDDGLSNDVAGVYALVDDVNRNTALLGITLVECPIGAVGAPVTWCDALMRVDKSRAYGCKRVLFQDSRTIHDDDCGIGLFYGLNGVWRIDVLEMAYGTGHGFNRFHALFAQNRCNAMFGEAQQKWPGENDEGHLAQDAQITQLSNAVSQQRGSGSWLFDKCAKQAKLAHQMVVDNPCGWIIAADQQDFGRYFGRLGGQDVVRLRVILKRVPVIQQNLNKLTCIANPLQAACSFSRRKPKYMEFQPKIC